METFPLLSDCVSVYIGGAKAGRIVVQTTLLTSVWYRRKGVISRLYLTKLQYVFSENWIWATARGGLTSLCSGAVGEPRVSQVT